MGNGSSTLHTSTAVRFRFPNFLDWPTEKKGRMKLSKESTDINNNVWQLGLYTGGIDGNPGSMSLCLVCRENPKEMIFRRITLAVRNGVDGSVAHEVHGMCNYNSRKDTTVVLNSDPHRVPTYGWQPELTFDERNLPDVGGLKFVLEGFMKPVPHPGILRHGVLVIDAIIEINQHVSAAGVPPNTLSQNMLKLFESEQMADVSFDIDGKVIYAHKFILAVNAPLIAEFCKDCTKETPVSIAGVTSEVFLRILRYIYGENAPDTRDDVLQNGFNLIDAANRFGIIELKLSLERSLVKYITFDISNVVQCITFADSMTLPLLKERATSYFLARARDVLKSDSSSKLSDGLMEELMLAVLDSEDEPLGNQDNIEYTDMPVEVLREKLNRLGLDLDGSREVLVSRLQPQV